MKRHAGIHLPGTVTKRSARRLPHHRHPVGHCLGPCDANVRRGKNRNYGVRKPSATTKPRRDDPPGFFANIWLFAAFFTP